MADEKRVNVSEDENLIVIDEYDPTVDFFSEKFDPLKALNTPNIKAPVIDAFTHDNLAMYERAHSDRSKQQVEKAGSSKTQTNAIEPEMIERKWLPHQLPIQTERKVPFRNILTRMETVTGPMVLLKKCKDERLRIKVWTRHSHDIRGYCIAFVVAFDKHWNLLLEDVTEVWTRLKRRKTPALGPAHDISRKYPIVPPVIKVIKTDKKTETCERHVDQFVVRGEQVALIAVLPTS